MPCYQPEETSSDLESKRLAKLIVIFNEKKGITTPDDIVEMQTSWYENHCDYLCPILCDKIKSLNESEEETILYNGRDKDSRKLATWWDEHLEADEKNRNR